MEEGSTRPPRLAMIASSDVVPDAFTHETSAERLEWFKRGLKSGDPDQCDTFSE